VTLRARHLRQLRRKTLFWRTRVFAQGPHRRFPCNRGREANPLRQEPPGSHLGEAKGFFAMFNNRFSAMLPCCADFCWGRDTDRETQPLREQEEHGLTGGNRILAPL